MELRFPKVEIEKSEDFKTKSFGIGDKRVIINILRSKMYSDPIYIICQEIMSNSRDAHREVGTPETPIIITLPSRISETIKFQDFGPGISPNRMENVFILYGQSTKRVNNIQTGGFGLGAKTPFAYTDSFNIITVTQDGDKRFRREYIAYIDETQIGAMSLIKAAETTEHTGTTIAIPVKKDDCRRFEQDVLRVSQFWKTKPIIKGANKTWNEDDVEFQGTNWYMAKGNASGYSWRSQAKPLVIIDGIQYPLKVETIRGKLNQQQRLLTNRDIRLFFETGELKVTANREDLDYQPEIIDKIVSRLKDSIKELKASVDKAVIGAKSLKEAIIAWSKAEISYKNVVDRPKWKGLELISSFIPKYSYEQDIETFVYERDFEQGPHGNVRFRAHRKSRYRHKTILVDDSYVLFEHDDDCARPSVQKIRTLFTDNPKATHVAGIKFLNSNGRIETESEFNWSKLNPIKLSNTIKAKIVRQKTSGKSGKKRNAIVNVKELSPKYSARVGEMYEWKPASNMTVNDSGVFVVLYNGSQYSDAEKKRPLNKYSIYKIAKLLDVPVYGVLSRAAKKLGPQWTSLKDHCNVIIKKLESSQKVKEHLERGSQYSLVEYADTLWKNFKERQNDFNKGGTAWKYIEESKKSEAGSADTRTLLKLQGYLGIVKSTVENDKMKKMQIKFKKDYPLISRILKHYYMRDNGKFNENLIKEFTIYANVKDASIKPTSKKDGNV